MPFAIIFRRYQRHIAVAAGMPYRDTLVLPVDGCPLQAPDFSLPHAGAYCQEYHLPELALGVLQKLVTLIPCQVVRFWRCISQQLDDRHRGAVPFVGALKALAEYGQLVVYSFIRQPACHLLCLEPLHRDGADFTQGHASEERDEVCVKYLLLGVTFREPVVGNYVLLVPLLSKLPEGLLLFLCIPLFIYRFAAG